MSDRLLIVLNFLLMLVGLGFIAAQTVKVANIAAHVADWRLAQSRPGRRRFWRRRGRRFRRHARQQGARIVRR